MTSICMEICMLCAVDQTTDMASSVTFHCFVPFFNEDTLHCSSLPPSCLLCNFLYACIVVLQEDRDIFLLPLIYPGQFLKAIKASAILVVIMRW